MRNSDHKLSQNSRISVTNDTGARLIRALSALWEQSDQNEISVRAIAATAEASPSAIDYHFGSLGQLFDATQDMSMRKARQWMERKLADIADAGLQNWPLAARAGLLASIIDEWTETQRPLALAWREAQTATNRPGAHERWAELWRWFVTDLCARTGLDRWHETLLLFIDGEAGQHLVRWRRPLDRALLDETVLALLDFLENGNMLPSSAVRDSYQRAADAKYGPSRTPLDAATLFDDAAAALLADEGLSALTFRAVARRAGATLGTVGYHFGSKAEMAQRAVRRLYEMSAVHSVADLVASFPASSADLLEEIVESVVTDSSPVLRAFDEISLHLSRGNDNASFRAVTRSFRDPIGMAVLGGLLRRDTTASSLAAAFSSIVRGYGHHCRTLPREQAKKLGHRALAVFASH
jgi:AcrR family transcriptional regulator